MGGSCSSGQSDVGIGEQQATENGILIGRHLDNQKQVIITNNNSLIEGKKWPPPSDGLKSAMKGLENGNAHEYDMEVVPLVGQTVVALQHPLPLMDPMVVNMLVEKMEMMKQMKQLMSMNGQSPTCMSKGAKVDIARKQMPPGVDMVDGQMPSMGMMIPPKGMAPPKGMMPPGGKMPPPSGKMPPFPSLPKLLGDVTNAVAVVRHMKSVFNSQEIQELCEEKMDPSERNIMFKMMQCKLAMEFKVLHDIGMLHLAHLVATGKLPHLLQLVLMGYHDEPEVMKELSFIGPLARHPGQSVRKGDPVPDISLQTCAEEATSLNDLHLNKDRPLVIFAASSS